MRISVIGCGYLGATHAAAMARLGFEVVGVEPDEAKVRELRQGRSPVHEPGLDDLLIEGVKECRLRFTTNIAEVADWADVHFICVGTPQRREDLGADVSQLNAVVGTLAPLLTSPSLVVGKSTVPVGTAQRLRCALQAMSPAGLQAELAWNPEFLREGFAVEDTLRPDRLVFGIAPGSQGAMGLLHQVYAEAIAADTPVIECDLETAEMVKVAANGFLATKISYINAVAEMCEVAGADIRILADAMGHDTRIGRRFLNAGVGFGGGCLPKDIRAMVARAGELGVADAFGILREVDQVNLRQRQRVVDRAEAVLNGTVVGANIAVLGAAFKPNSDDVRDSPALDVAGRLQLAGARVTVFDPEAMANAAVLRPTLRYADTLEEACSHADLVILLTEWDQFRRLRPEQLERVVRSHVMIDARNCLDPDLWRGAGWDYRGMGVPWVPPHDKPAEAAE